MNPIIIALDFKNRQEVESFIAKLPDQPFYFKVGMQLYYREGANLVELLIAQGHQVFLDLKLHDIPNTVSKATEQLADFNTSMTNVHAAGGSVMMKAAKESFPKGKLIAVTQLTSISEEQLQKEQGSHLSMQESVLNYARLAKNAGLDGVVCSAYEAPLIHEHCGKDFLCVCPGIRFASDEEDDQKRVMTAYEAAKNGADYIVVGRSITQAQDPYKAYERMLKEWNDGKNN